MRTKLILVFIFGALFSSIIFADSSENSDADARFFPSTNFIMNKIRGLQKQVNSIKRGGGVYKQERGTYIGSMAEMYAHGPAVVTSPSLGVRRSADDASDLMINLSSIHEDLTLLKLRKKMDDYARANGILIPQRPIIAFSGGVEGRASYAYDYKNRKGDVNLSRAELDIVGEAGPWATASMIISYDDSKTVGTRVSNSRLKIDRAFLTLGQLSRSPFYFTIGQIYAPFGRYSSYMLTDTSTKILGRLKDRMAVLGFSNCGFNVQVYGFSGETKIKDHSNILKHSGFNVDFSYEKNKLKVDLGGSIIGNLAESVGMQSRIFNKIDSSDSSIKGSPTITSRIYGLNGRVKASYDMFTILAEYVTALKSFDKADISFNGEGAKPQALSLEGAVEFKMLGKPNTFAIGYGQSGEALALNLPKRTFFTSYSASFFKNTIFSLEYRHDINYGSNDKAKGNGTLREVKVDGSSRNENRVTVQIGVYF